MENRILIFSLLNLRKKTSAVVGGIMIAMACLWGIAWWQDLSPRQLLNLLLGTLLLIVGIMLLAVILVVVFKLVGRWLQRGPGGNS